MFEFDLDELKRELAEWDAKCGGEPENLEPGYEQKHYAWLCRKIADLTPLEPFDSTGLDVHLQKIRDLLSEVDHLFGELRERGCAVKAFADDEGTHFWLARPRAGHETACEVATVRHAIDTLHDRWY